MRFDMPPAEYPAPDVDTCGDTRTMSMMLRLSDGNRCSVVSVTIVFTLVFVGVNVSVVVAAMMVTPLSSVAAAVSRTSCVFTWLSETMMSRRRMGSNPIRRNVMSYVPTSRFGIR
jgi:hypothetical protein